MFDTLGNMFSNVSIHKQINKLGLDFSMCVQIQLFALDCLEDWRCLVKSNQRRAFKYVDI